MQAQEGGGDIFEEGPVKGPGFPTTRWTLVTRAREGGEVQRAALEELCGLYWYPLYVFLRRRGFPAHDAEDLTQGFFLELLQSGTFEAADQDKGKLRTFLLQSLVRYLAGRRRYENAQKRGSGKAAIAFEAMDAEERYAHEPVDRLDPESLFTRAWARLLMQGVRDRLRTEFAEAGRSDVFEILLPFLLGDEAPPSYREVARKLDASETSVRLLVLRMRGRFRDRLREEVAQTVLDPQDVAEEMAWLKSVLLAP